MTAPTLDPKAVYRECVNSISDKNLRNRLKALTNDIAAAAGDYHQRGVAKKLYTISPNNCGDDDVVLGAVTKKELKNVYSSYMVGRTKPGRKIYESLLSTAPSGRCPFCGVGHASTLDHYLPKSKYPQLSVLPLNLVPSCKDCNTGKNSAIVTKEEMQGLHPYFDHNGFVCEQWLFAEVVSNSPETLRYFVRAPKDWDDVSKERVQSHFECFKLAKRYAIEAANELAGRKLSLDEFKKNNGYDRLVDFLSSEAESFFTVHPNSWQTAFYQALASYIEVQNVVNKSSFVRCPVCEGEAVLVGQFCPCCKGSGEVQSCSLHKINISDYEFFKCPECDGSPRCFLCGGSKKIDRSKALQTTRKRQ